ncbi:MAG: ABC transporter permease [Erysipelothrix sp.]|nr:ABC transporter permease [Erysipelothrix sp.]
MIKFLINVIEQGALYGVLSIGVLLTYRVIGISDLSVDGSYPLGAVVSAVVIINGGSAWLGLAASLAAGLLAGAMTGLLHVKLRISSLLSGILVMTGLYSINLMIAGGRSNLPLLKEKTLFDTAWLESINAPDIIVKYYRLILLLIIVMVIKWVVDWVLATKMGYLLKVTGDNEGLVTVLGHDVGKVKIIGLALSNGLVALSGGIAASVGRYYDVSLGVGMIVIGLSSVMLGMLLLGNTKAKLTTQAIVGSIVYRLIVALAIRFGLDPQHMKLITVIIFIVAIVLNNASISLNFIDKKGANNA